MTPNSKFKPSIYATKPGVWISKEGKETLVKDLDDNHLNNCIRLLERKCKDKEREYYTLYKKEIKIDPLIFYSIYKDLIQEQNRRKVPKNITNDFIYDDDEILGIEPKNVKSKSKTKITKEEESEIYKRMWEFWNKTIK